VLRCRGAGIGLELARLPDGGTERLRFVGRDMLRAFRYRPQALQIVEPVGDRRHNGVRVVPQLLWVS
jgi:hypothetical protein